MQTIKIEYQSAWQTPEVFETDDVNVAMEIAESGVQQQYIVLVNGNRYRSLSSFGKSIKLND